MWVKFTSWHIVETAPTDDELGVTLCGKEIQRNAEIRKDWAGNEKTCESCLRINAE